MKTHTETNATCACVAVKDGLPSSGAAAADCLLFQIAAEMSPRVVRSAAVEAHVSPARRVHPWNGPRKTKEKRRRVKKVSDVFAERKQQTGAETQKVERDDRVTEVWGGGDRGGGDGVGGLEEKTKGATAERRGG